MKLTELIREIRSFMQGADQSNSPRLQQFVEEYTALCCELEKDLETCRESLRLGNISEARRINRSFEPPLSSRVQMLNFPEREDFLKLCTSYGYPLPPSFDEAILLQLNSSAGHSERKLAELMQRWRQQARSAGTVEKLQILRSIVELVPEKNALEWQKNLAALERQRDAEIANELTAKEWSIKDLPQLKKMHLELRFPGRCTKAPENTLLRMDELLKPLQRREIAESAEKLAECMQQFYAERNLPELRKAMEEWKILKSHPLQALTPEQLQLECDIVKFLEDMAQNDSRRRQYEELLAQLKQGLSENQPYTELERLYCRLLLLELPPPEKLVERMTILKEEFDANEHRKNVRRCVYSGVAALLLLGILAGVVVFTMHFRQVEHICSSYEALLKKGDFNSVLEKYRQLLKESPRIAHDSRVEKFYQSAQSERLLFQQNEKHAHEVCKRNLGEIEKLLQNNLLESAQIDQFFQELRPLKKYLSKEEADQFGRLKTLVAEERSKIRQKQMENFETEAGKIFQALEQLKQKIRSTPELPELSEELEQQKKRYNKLLAGTPKTVLEQLERKTGFEWKTRLGELEYQLKQEKDLRDVRARLESPKGLPEFLAALHDARDRQPELARSFAKAAIPEQEAFADRLNRAAIFVNSNDVAELLDGRKVFPEELRDTPLGADIGYCAFLSGGFDVKKFLDTVVQNLNLYEIVFKTRDEQPVYFYTKDKPRIIRSSLEREKIRGIRLDILPGRGQKTVPVMLTLTDEKKRLFHTQFPLKRLPELQGFESLVLVSGLELVSAECQKNAAYAIAVRFQAETPESQNQEEYFRRLFQEMASGSIRNPRLRAFLLCQLLTGLGKNAPVYADVLAPFLGSLEKFCKDKKRDILSPLAAFQTEELQTALQFFSAEQLLAEKDRITKFYFETITKGLCPLGIINSQLKPYFWGSNQSELLVAFPDRLQLLQSDFSSGKINAADQKLIWPGQILWGFVEDFQCRKYFSPEAHPKLKLERRPALWPGNLYFRNH